MTEQKNILHADGNVFMIKVFPLQNYSKSFSKNTSNLIILQLFVLSLKRDFVARLYDLLKLMQMYRKPGCVIIPSQSLLIKALHDFCTSYKVYAIAI